MNYTHKNIVDMRKLVVDELVKEMHAKGLEQATPSYVNFDTAEDRLRTYIQAGLTVVDLEGGDSRADEDARAKEAYAALATTTDADRYPATSDTKPDTGVMS